MLFGKWVVEVLFKDIQLASPIWQSYPIGVYISSLESFRTWLGANLKGKMKQIVVQLRCWVIDSRVNGCCACFTLKAHRCQSEINTQCDCTTATHLSSHVTYAFSWSPSFLKQHLLLLVFIFAAWGNLCTHLSGVKQLEISELWEQGAVCQGEICLSTAHGCTMVWVSLKWTWGIRANQKLITLFWLLNHAREKWQTVWFNGWEVLNTNMALCI